MRTAKVMVILVVLVGAGVALYWYTTKSNRAADVMDTRGMVEDPGYEDAPAVLEAAPADTAAVADTVSVY